MNIMNGENQNIIAQTYVNKESFKDALPWFENLRQNGLNPLYVTMDGERSIIRALKLTWPSLKLQRCLYHIQHEGTRWLRTYPKTKAGRDLRRLLMKVCFIRTIKEQYTFIYDYNNWVLQYKNFIKNLNTSNIAFKDLKRTVNLINNALPDMFHYLIDSNIRSTTNCLEGFHSRLKTDYQRHRGLIRSHRTHYLQWYSYFKNLKKSNIL